MAEEHAPEIPVRFYRTALGKEPVLEWLRSLDRGDRRAIGLDLMRVQFGWPIGMPLVRPEGWFVGGSVNVTEPTDCTTHSVLPPRHSGSASRLYQKDAQDTAGRSCAREATDEGGDDMKKKNPHIGSSLDDFLKEEGIREEVRATALKEALAWQVHKAMKRAKINKVEMARRMNTSRAALDRLLDPGNASVTLQTLCRAARAIGRDLRIELV
jgi:antitoxin HicB